MATISIQLIHAHCMQEHNTQAGGKNLMYLCPSYLEAERIRTTLLHALAAIPGFPPSAGVETSAGLKMLGFRLAHTLRYEKG